MELPQMNERSSVTILLATHNGANYLPVQLDSIRAQTHEDWTLLARDDGSSDETPDILRSFERADSRISVLRDGGGMLGVIRNFERLARHALSRPGDVYAFADQDDWWHATKLSRQLEALRAPRHPRTLVFTDLEVAGPRLRVRHPSYMAFQGIRHPDRVTLDRLLVQNIVVGNTVVVTRQLLELALPFPSNLHMHDWWLALCAAGTGSLVYLSEAMTRYRLHGSNVAGAGGLKSAFNLLRPEWWGRLQKMQRIFIRSFVQAEALRARIEERCGSGDSEEAMHARSALRAYLGLLALPIWSRIFSVRNGFPVASTPVLSLLFRLHLACPNLVERAREAVYDSDSGSPL
jgi:glycosyltransferase involved in cell wall biosynthesis